MKHEAAAADAPDKIERKGDTEETIREALLAKN